MIFCRVPSLLSAIARSSRLVIPVMLLAGGTRAPLVAAETGSRVDEGQARQIVEYHNQKRNEVGVGPLAWSPRLAEFAQKRADTIARTKKFAHLPRGKNPYGENLAQGGSTGAASTYTVVNACEDWFAEKAKMPQDASLMTMALFKRGVGHYTQMVWSETTELGAGIAHYQQNGFAMTVIVCTYNPPGNLIGGTIFSSKR